MTAIEGQYYRIRMEDIIKVRTDSNQTYTLLLPGRVVYNFPSFSEL